MSAATHPAGRHKHCSDQELLMKFFTAALLALASAQAFSHPSHCSKEEKTVFSCLIGKKVVSVCASENLSPTDGYMQYRFGKPGHLERRVPAKEAHPFKEKVGANAYDGPQGSQNGTIDFVNGDHSYTVFWDSHRSETNQENGANMWFEISGIRVLRKEKLLAEMKCGPSSPGDVLYVDEHYLHTQVGFPKE
jgi:hypothetical protein